MRRGLHTNIRFLHNREKDARRRPARVRDVLRKGGDKAVTPKRKKRGIVVTVSQSSDYLYLRRYRARATEYGWEIPKSGKCAQLLIRAGLKTGESRRVRIEVHED